MRAVDRPREHVEQVARERVEPVAVLEHDHLRVGARERPQAVGQEALERGLAQLRVERRRQLRVRDRQAEHGVEQRRALDERRVDVGQRLLERLQLLGLGHRLRHGEQSAPDLSPDRIGRAGAERLTLAEGDEMAVAARVADELGE